MSRNTALVTDAAKAAAQSDLDDYATGATAHIGGDWGGHRHLRVHDGVNYTSAAGPLSSSVARMLLTDDAGVDCAVVTPVFFVASASTSIPPLIAVQPQNCAVVAGQNAKFSVYAASPTSMTYQWQAKLGTALDFTNIAGANEASYNIIKAATSSTGKYRVVVSNSYGSVTSTEATLSLV